MRAQTALESRDARLVCEWRVAILCGRRGIVRIDAPRTVHVVLPLRIAVVTLEVRVRERPCRRRSAVMFDFTEVIFAQAKERAAVELRVATDTIVRERAKRL